MKEFAMLHGDTLIWAGVALVGGIFAVLKFSGGLQGLFSRVRKLPGGFELDPVATQQSSSEVSPPLSRPAESNVQPGLFPEISVRANSEKYLRDVLKTVPPEDRENYLLETLLNVTASWHFEISNFLIMGSQLALLQVLNSSAQSMQDAKGFFDTGVQNYPDFYKNYSFDAWMNWLIEHVKFIRKEGDVLSISHDGREFLKYVVSRGYRLYRPS